VIEVIEGDDALAVLKAAMNQTAVRRVPIRLNRPSRHDLQVFITG
jgi:hypothetical protein